MNCLFLDIDGVLRTHKSDLEWSEIDGIPIPTVVFNRKFSRKSISNLNYIVRITGANVVISSTWRLNFSVDELNNIFRKNGFNGKIIGKTGVLFTRGEEIQEYLDLNDIDKYAVIDDQVKDIKPYINIRM